MEGGEGGHRKVCRGTCCDMGKLPTLAFTVRLPTGACYLYKLQRVTNPETDDMLETAINEVVEDIQTELGEWTIGIVDLPSLMLSGPLPFSPSRKLVRM